MYSDQQNRRSSSQLLVAPGSVTSAEKSRSSKKSVFFGKTTQRQSLAAQQQQQLNTTAAAAATTASSSNSTTSTAPGASLSHTNMSVTTLCSSSFTQDGKLSLNYASISSPGIGLVSPGSSSSAWSDAFLSSRSPARASGAHLIVREADKISSLVLAGDLNALRMLLSEAATISLNTRDSRGLTPLAQCCLVPQPPASLTSCYKSAQLLLELGASPQISSTVQAPYQGNTPLHFACESGNEDLVLLLLKHGADINSKNALGKTPLHISVENGWEDLVALLLELGSRISVNEDYDAQVAQATNIALNTSATSASRSIGANLSVSHGNDNSSRRGSLPLGEVNSLGNVSTYLLQSPSSTTTSSSILSSLSFGLRRNRNRSKSDAAKQALAVLPPPPSPILMACVQGSVPLLEFLIQHLPEDVLDRVSEMIYDPVNGNSMLMTACQYGRTEVVDFLLSNHFASIAERSCAQFGWTAFHFAAFLGFSEICALLLRKFGANIDEKDDSGRTALHLASAAGHAEIVTLLIEKFGARVDLRDEQGHLALDLAIESIHYHRVARAFRSALAARDQARRAAEAATASAAAAAEGQNSAVHASAGAAAHSSDEEELEQMAAAAVMMPTVGSVAAVSRRSSGKK